MNQMNEPVSSNSVLPEKTMPLSSQGMTSAVSPVTTSPTMKTASRIDVLKNTYARLPKKMKLLIILGMVVLTFLILSLFSKHPQSSSSAAPTPTPTLTPLPVVTSGPTYTPVPTSKVVPLPTAWTQYPNSGHLSQFGITLTYPFGWKAQYKLDTASDTADQAIDFDFLPANMNPVGTSSANMGWGGITIYIYPTISNMDTWFTKYNPKYLNNYTIPQPDPSVSGTLQISDIIPTTGNLPTLYVSSRSSRFYQIKYSPYGVKGFSDSIHSVIFPTIRFD